MQVFCRRHRAFGLTLSHLTNAGVCVIKHLSLIGQSANYVAARLLPAAALTLVLATPAGAQPLAQTSGLEPSAPENLRCPGVAGPRDGFHFEAQWQNVATYAGAPFEVALDHNCDLFVANKGSNQILKYDANGRQVAAWSMAARDSNTDGVAAVAVAPDGTLYVADQGLDTVRKLDSSGQQVSAWTSCDCVGQPGWMVAPVSVAVDGTGNNVYVLDQSADTVSRYSPDGKVQKVFGSSGSGPRPIRCTESSYS